MKNMLFSISFWIFITASLQAFPSEYDRPLYAGSRPLGMGNAYIAVCDDAEASFWNPAGIIQWQGVKISASTQVSDRSKGPVDSKCIAYCYRDTGFAWGNKIALRVNGETPDFNYYSIAYKLNPFFAAGVSLKFKRRHPCEYYQFFGYKTSYDLGLLWKSESGRSSGILIQNLADKKQLVDVITFGLANEWSSFFGRQDRVLLSMDVSIFPERHRLLEPHIGWEWKPNRILSIRAGLSELDLTIGLGFSLYRIRVDYAWISDNNRSFLSASILL